MHYPIYEYGGTGEIVHMYGGNGFPPQVYGPMLAAITKAHRVISALPRPLWPNPPAPESMETWLDFADDLLGALDMRGLTDVTLVGHSLGGIVSLLAVVKEPERFTKLALIDPVLFLPEALQQMAARESSPLARQALRRRARFQTLAEAFTYWRGQRFFEQWSDEMLQRYTEGLLTQDTDGGYQLRWPPAWEARIFNTPFVDVWAQIEALSPDLPVLVMRGGTTDVFMEAAAARFQAYVPQTGYKVIEGHGHTFPITAADETGDLLNIWLTSA